MHVHIANFFYTFLFSDIAKIPQFHLSLISNMSQCYLYLFPEMIYYIMLQRSPLATSQTSPSTSLNKIHKMKGLNTLKCCFGLILHALVFNVCWLAFPVKWLWPLRC